MKTRNIAGIILFVVGNAGLILSVTADLLGVGKNPVVFGLWQMVGTLAGAVLAITGLVMIMRKPGPAARERRADN